MAYTTIAKPSVHFDCPTWTGSSSTTTISGMGFKPDMIWIKRYDGSGHPLLNNSSEGTGQNWIPSGNNANDTNTLVASYTSDGFTLTGGGTDVNENAEKYVAACWKANGGTTSSNGSGSITSTVQANTTAGISVVQYTGTGATGTIGHSLGAVPKLIIAKSTTVADRGVVYIGDLGHYSDTEDDLIQFAATSQFQDDAGGWNDTKPTSTVFTVGNKSHHNTSGAASIAYCFAEIKGFSKFGIYAGSGNVKGVPVYCGFRPKWLMIKKWESTEDWAAKTTVVDEGQIAGTSEMKRALQFSDNSSSTDCTITATSWGFRASTTDAKANSENAEYLYMAFAEMPVVGTNGTVGLAI
tara:strand:- start:1532 stop:2590 length:1059 start_codon:yes stop_codon:yes gene_type:complete